MAGFQKCPRLRKQAVLFFLAVFIMAGLIMPARPVSAEPPVLPKVGSKEKLLELLQQCQSRYSGNYPAAVDSGSAQKSSEPIPAPAAAENASGDFSKTNTQVAGVDEADLVKTDGQYIYQVSDNYVFIIKAVPGNGMSLLSRISLTDPDFRPLEIYVDSSHLVLIGQSEDNGPIFEPFFEDGKSMCPPPYFMQVTRAAVYDISDRSNPSKVREIDLEGSYLSSRKVGSSLYLVSNRYISYYGIANDEMLLPHYRDSIQGDTMKSLGYDKISYFPGCPYPGYISVIGFNLADNTQPASVESFLGNGENLYASTSRLYIALTSYHYNTEPLLKDSAHPGYADNKTIIHAFNMDGGRISYSAQGEVPGTILNQFSMDAFGGNLRIATTTGDAWRSDAHTSRNNIYVLDHSLKIIGSLTGIAPGEKIYSTRFMGDRAYMVTFRKVDPFFVIDMSDPSHPSILGKLKIPGYSDYLHPYDENHIIGFGKETIEVKDSAYYQGMKLALFDVSDVENPIEISRAVIGDRGTESELLYNHKALTFSKERGIMAFPVKVMTVQGNASNHSTGMPAYGSFSFQGAYFYHIDLENGIQYQGRISHISPDEYLKAGDYWYDSASNIRRILYIGDTFYTLSDAMVQSHRMNDLGWVGGLVLNQ